MIVWFVVLLAFVGKSFAQSPDCSATDPLQCYLNDVEILIPSFCIELNTTQKEFCLLEFMCHGVVIGGINSTYVYKQPTTIDVALQNAGTTCDGKNYFSCS